MTELERRLNEAEMHRLRDRIEELTHVLQLARVSCEVLAQTCRDILDAGTDPLQ